MLIRQVSLSETVEWRRRVLGVRVGVMDQATVIDEARVAAAVERLEEAYRTGVPCRPVRDLIGPNDVAAGYTVQERLIQSRIRAGSRRVGRKIGLTSTAVQQQLGVDQPDFGVLLDDMAYAGGDTIPSGSVMQPRIEAEIAFVLGADLMDGPLDSGQVRGAVSYATPALEVCGSRIAEWDISFGDTVADNASAGAFVLGPLRKRLDEFEPRDVEMSMSVNGVERSAGTGAACLGDPLEAVAWLARLSRDLGSPLRSGEVILSGALGPMFTVESHVTVAATISGLGKVAATVA